MKQLSPAILTIVGLGLLTRPAPHKVNHLYSRNNADCMSDDSQDSLIFDSEEEKLKYLRQKRHEEYYFWESKSHNSRYGRARYYFPRLLREAFVNDGTLPEQTLIRRFKTRTGIGMKPGTISRRLRKYLSIGADIGIDEIEPGRFKLRLLTAWLDYRL